MQYLADGPTSTTILEMWREGLEDADYLALLREQLDRVKAATKGKDTSKELRRLIARAQHYGSVPDSVTRGKFAEARIYQTYRPLWDVLGHKECRRIEAALVVKSSADSMAHQLSAHGPLWYCGTAGGYRGLSGDHVIVITGIRDTVACINDPWPVGQGWQGEYGFDNLRRNLPQVAFAPLLAYGSA